MSKILVLDSSKCTACRRCELACSFHHTGAFSPAAARLKVEIFPEEDFYYTVTCQQCDDAVCAAVCPAGAITRNAATGAWEIQDARCVGCRMCVMVCPFGAAMVSVPEYKVVKCDLCGGEPECVAFCAQGALAFQEAGDLAAPRQKRFALQMKSLLGEVG